MDPAAEESINLIRVLAVATAEWLFDTKKSGYGMATVQESCGQGAGKVQECRDVAYIINNALGRPVIPKVQRPGARLAAERRARRTNPGAEGKAPGVGGHEGDSAKGSQAWGAGEDTGARGSDGRTVLP